LTRRPALLQTLAATAWGATIIGAFTGYDPDWRHYSALDERLWFTVLGIAVVASLPVVFGTQLADRIDRAFLAMFRARISQLETPEPSPHGRHRLAVVPAQAQPQDDASALSG
jgi:hypothetical protein